MEKLKINWLLIWILFCSNKLYLCEYFTSTSHLRSLFQLELRLVHELNYIINQEEIRLKKLKEFYNRIGYLNKLKEEQYGSIIANPISVYKMLKRFNKEWQNLNEVITIDYTEDFRWSVQNYENRFPTDNDVEGAKDALFRLQETFNLPAKEMNNEMSGFRQNKLGADDAFEIGKTAYLKQNYPMTLSWMDEALSLLSSGVYTIARPSKFDILDHLAWTEYMTNDIPAAYNHTLELLQLDPSNNRIQANLELYLRNLQKNEGKVNNNKRTPSEVKKKYERYYHTANEDATYRYDVESKRMKALCRGETDPIPEEQIPKLVCWYKQNHPLLSLKPAKIERKYCAPEILVYHDAMTDYEIDKAKKLAHPMLQRAKVHNPATGKLEVADYRTSKSAWLDEEADPFIAKMNKRIEAYVGLNMKTSEQLQVANYGIGGHYETHFDFARTVKLRPPPWKNRTDYTIRVQAEEPELVKRWGNRLATMLFYMSDVEKGGATVFTNIGQAFHPKKGTAVFWYNLHHDGSGDPDTRHAACPVLIGEKWVSNRWLHERGQEFRRRCRLKAEDDYHLEFEG